MEERPPQASSFGALLRRYRLAAGLSQEALAERARMSVRGIGALERGDRRTPQRVTLALLADALALAPDERKVFEAAGDPRSSRGPRDASGDDASSYAPPLPNPLTSFVGRDREVRDIVGLVREHRLVTVTGAGGIGKTRAALEAASALAAAGDDVWLAELVPLGETRRVAHAVASALGLQESPTRPLVDVVVAFLERRRSTIVLDNCEHVVDDARDVARTVLQRCPDVRILATSREALGVPGERRFGLPPLAVPPAECALSAERLLDFDGSRLFAERAAAADERFAPTDTNAPHIADICRRLDGMPLALELAAARVRMFSPKEIAERLDDRFRLLADGDHAVPRQRTMRALIDWSYDLLSEQERALFRTLAIFSGGFTLATAAAVRRALGEDGDATLDHLSSLVDKSLVAAETDDVRTRYRLLESMQLYGRERLALSAEEDAAARAHAGTFLALAERVEVAYGDAPDDLWQAQAANELDNWRTALAWSLRERGDVRVGLALAAALRWVWLSRACVEGRQWNRLALDACGADTAPALVSALHLANAHYDAWFGNYPASRESAQYALHLLGDEADACNELAAECRWRIGNALVVLGDPAAGEATLHSALRTFEALGRTKLAAWVEICLGMARAAQGDGAGAAAAYARALETARERGYGGVAMVALGNLAEADFRDGKTEAALRHAAEALTGARRVRSTTGCAFHLCNMAAYLNALGLYESAATCALEALELSRDVRAEVLTTVILQHLVAATVLRGDERATREGLRASRLLGYVDARLSALGAVREFTESREYESIEAALAAAMGGEQVALLAAEGRVWTLERAIAAGRAMHGLTDERWP